MPLGLCGRAKVVDVSHHANVQELCGVELTRRPPYCLSNYALETEVGEDVTRRGPHSSGISPHTWPS